MSKYTDSQSNLDVSNPAPRCPVVLLLDTSGSMEGEPIDELNLGVRQFLRETSEDEAAGMSVELEIITFNSSVTRAVPFSPIAKIGRKIEPFEAYGMTNMGAALRMAAEDLKQRRSLYRRTGVSSYRPWVVLMTDGRPGDNWKAAAQELRELGEKNRIQYIGIEIGNRADHGTLCQILPSQPGPVRLQGLRFREFFKWLTDSLRSVSSSTPSQEAAGEVRLADPSSWADLASLTDL